MRQFKKTGSIAAQFMTAVIAASLSACTTISIQNNDGSVDVKRHLGVLAVELTPNTRQQLFSAIGIGIMARTGELNLGYYDMDLALLGTECRLILWIKNEAQLTTAYELFGEHKDICVMEAKN